MCCKFVVNIKANKMRQFYLDNYPTDELGVEIKEETNFYGLLNCLWQGLDVYDYIGVGDSLIRQRLFEELAKRLERPYEEVHLLWLKNN